MSWASIAKTKTKPKTKTTSKILVQYNYQPYVTVINEQTDNIPRHKEKTPDPADDFTMTNGQNSTSNYNNNNINNSFIDYWTNWKEGWIDYTTDKHLYRFKKSLPLSIQRIIEFANNIFRNGKVINLNFNEINEDLKAQYLKYNGDPTSLKKIFYLYYYFPNL